VSDQANTEVTTEPARDTGQAGSTFDVSMGGQAVIEGVMMRSPHAIATAVRLPDGSIEMKRRLYTSFVHRHRLLNIPVVRGAISFFEMLVIGIETLNWSAEIQMKYEDEKSGTVRKEESSFLNGLVLWGSMAVALVVGLGVFFALPILIATLLGLARGALVFNFVAGVIRLGLFVLYLSLISRMPDIRRVFRYHGAEHKSIFALESSSALDVESTRRESRFHPRCGTSFILIVAIAAIVLFGIADSFFPTVFGHMQTIPQRLATHLLLLPFVAGISYEALKISGRFRSHGLVKFLIAPGLWLQTMTTGEPDDAMIEVALCALKAALAKETAE
jgi:uncharacterized protein YqhQ